VPGSYSIEGDILRLTFVGDTEMDEVEAVVDAALADPTLPPMPYVLTDMRGSTSVTKRTQDEMRRGADIFASRGERLENKHAVLATDPTRYGMMRMASAFAESAGLEVRVFTEEADALEWLRESEKSRHEGLETPGE